MINKGSNKYKQETFKKDNSNLRKKRFEAIIRDLLVGYFFKDSILHLLNLNITKIDVSKDLKNCKVFYKISEIQNTQNENIKEAELKNSLQSSKANINKEEALKKIENAEDMEFKLRSLKKEKNIKEIYKILKLNCIPISNFLFKEMNLKSRIFLNFIYDDMAEKIEMTYQILDKIKQNIDKKEQNKQNIDNE